MLMTAEICEGIQASNNAIKFGQQPDDPPADNQIYTDTQTNCNITVCF